MNVATLPPFRPAPVGAAYEDDFYAWTQEQAARLRAGDWPALDRDNLAEAIANLGRCEFGDLVSALRLVLLHMLKTDYQPTRRTRDGALLIAIHRQNAAYILKDNPGLAGRSAEAVARVYHGARFEASKETGLPLKRFPETCPYSLSEIETRDFAIDPDETAS